MKKQLMSIMVVGIAALFLGAGTFAYFSDAETSTGNTFTAGILDLKLSNDAVSWYDGVSGSWVASNMAPGDSTTGKLFFKNADNSVNMESIILDIDITAGGGQSLDDYLEITAAWFYVPDTGWVACLNDDDPGCQDPYNWISMKARWAGTDDHLMLTELCSGCQGDDMDHDDLIDGAGNYLAPGVFTGMKMQITFTDNGGNQDDAQGDSCTVTIYATAYNTEQ